MIQASLAASPQVLSFIGSSFQQAEALADDYGQRLLCEAELETGIAYGGEGCAEYEAGEPSFLSQLALMATLVVQASALVIGTDTLYNSDLDAVVNEGIVEIANDADLETFAEKLAALELLLADRDNAAAVYNSLSALLWRYYVYNTIAPTVLMVSSLLLGWVPGVGGAIKWLAKMVVWHEVSNMAAVLPLILAFYYLSGITFFTGSFTWFVT